MSGKFVVACGGTGGHVFPGLATAKALKARGHEVALLLSGRDVEVASVKGWDGGVIRIDCPKIRLRSPAGMLKAVPALIGAYRRSRKALGEFAPDAILAMGSYTSVAPALAARSLGIPLVLHEANAKPGLAIRFLSRFAAKIGVAVDSARAHLRGGERAANVGMPVRAELAGRPPMPAPPGAPHFAKTLLITGGSQGAHGLNLKVIDAMKILFARGEPMRVIHQTGKADAEIARAAYFGAGIPAEVYAFIAGMGEAYAAADLCVCRSGAATCFELCLCGTPAILVPLPTAAGDHQTANARCLEQGGAALCMPQGATTAEQLAEAISALMQDDPRRHAMSGAMKKLSKPSSAEELADLVETASK